MVGEPVAQRQVDGDADREGEEGLEANRRQFAEARGQADAEESQGEEPAAQLLQRFQRFGAVGLARVGVEHADDGGGQQ